MKKSHFISVVTLLFAMSFLLSSNALAKQKGAVHAYSDLGLSLEQKQDIKQIMRQLRDDNSVYRGEKSSTREQMQALMSETVWDEQRAEQIIQESYANRQLLKANSAYARHQAFHVLNEEQQTALIEKQARKQSRDKAENKDWSAKLQKRLALSDQQSAQLRAITDAQKEQMTDLITAMKEHKLAERALIQAKEFHREAYANLNEDFSETATQIALIQAKTRYDIRQILTDEQQQKLESRKKKYPKARRNRV